MLGYDINERLLPGIYKMDSSGLVTTWDIRMKIPNREDYLSPEVMHTLEHTMTHYLQHRYGKYRMIGVFPMGCQTGFRILTRFIDKRMIHEAIVDYAMNLQLLLSIPGVDILQCANCNLHDLREAKREMLKYYEQSLKYTSAAAKYNN